MTDINITKRNAHVNSVNLRKEFHGDESEKALDIGLTFACDADAVRGLFTEHESLIDHLWDVDGMPLMGGFVLKYQFKIEGLRAKIDRFIFEGCAVKKGLEARPGINRTFEITLALQIHPGSVKCADRLWSFRGEQLKLELIQTQTQLNLTQPDDEAETVDPEANTEAPNP